jgi:hypothetical protein
MFVYLSKFVDEDKTIETNNRSQTNVDVYVCDFEGVSLVENASSMDIDARRLNEQESNEVYRRRMSRAIAIE